MMANFDVAIAVLLAHEGGYEDTPGDAGGPTNFGICQRDNPTLDIPNLTQADATAYYQTNWWLKYSLDQVNDDDLATYWLDHGVNVGMYSITRIIQGLVGATPDGQPGPNTMAAVNANYNPSMMQSIQDQLWSHYLAILAVHPEDEVFKAGWYSRCYSA